METNVVCPVGRCGKTFKSNSGLSSHMSLIHKTNRSGEPLPASFAELRKANLLASRLLRREERAANKRSRISAAHTPEARAKAAKTNSERHFQRLRDKGIIRCPECWSTNHRAVDFASPAELGKHRRFKHGVVGSSHTAEKMRRLAKENVPAVVPAVPAAAPAVPAVPVVSVATENFPCPHCSRTFPKQHGLSIHVSQVHHKLPAETALTPPPSKELTNGHDRTQGVVQTETSNGTRNGYRNDAALAQALAIAHVTGVIENVLLTTASRYDIAPRQFAQRVVVALGERYSQER
jgi:uncharacterized C2H2 Zn-finger protein